MLIYTGTNMPAYTFVAGLLVLQVKLPQRVPHGFHAMWVTGDQIKQQQLPGFSLHAAK